MEWELDVVQPPHLLPFNPLVAQEVEDLLYTLPPRLSKPISEFLSNYLESMKVSWVWFYLRCSDLQQYFLSLQAAARDYHNPFICEGSPEGESDASFVAFLSLEHSVRVDESSEAIIWEQFGMHLPCWEIVLNRRDNGGPP